MVEILNCSMRNELYVLKYNFWIKFFQKGIILLIIIIESIIKKQNEMKNKGN